MKQEVYTDLENKNLLDELNEKHLMEDTWGKTKKYVPKVEELIVGYECYIKAPKYQGQKTIITVDEMQFAELCIRGDFLFTEYLTKEQIELEGWTSGGNDFQDGDRNDLWMYSKSNYGLLYNPSKQYLEINMKTDPVRYIYQGKCPSINEFRYITKLLNI